MNVLLNGQSVSPSEIDPKKHRYVGMWRPADHSEGPRLADGYRCPGCDLLCMEEPTAFRKHHWRKGCFDIPQYVSLKLEMTWSNTALDQWPNTSAGYTPIDRSKKPEPPARLRIPASEVKEGDVIVRHNGARGEVESVFDNHDMLINWGGYRTILEGSFEVEVERPNG